MFFPWISSFPWAGPNLAAILLFAGILAIYAEFCWPGTVAPGAIGSVLLLISVAALAAFPIDWRGTALILLALLCFVLEARSGVHGLFTLAGAISLFTGLAILIDRSRTEARIHPGVAVAIAVPFAGTSGFLFSVAVRARRNKKLVVILKKADRNHDSVG